MTTVALRDVFLSPPLAAERVIPASLAVLTSATDGPTAGTALALACGAPVAVVAIWSERSPHADSGPLGDHLPRDADSEPRSARSPRGGFALPPARRLAERLAARGLGATARGRLVTVALDSEPGTARAAAERAQAACGDAPFVLVVAGPRPPAFDPLLAAADRLLVVPPPGAPEGLEPLALAAAAHLARSAAVLRLPPTTPTTRLLATSGLALPPALRRLATTALADA
jgi:hypothetical protein